MCVCVWSFYFMFKTGINGPVISHSPKLRYLEGVEMNGRERCGSMEKAFCCLYTYSGGPTWSIRVSYDMSHMTHVKVIV